MNMYEQTWQDWYQLIEKINAEVDQVHRASKMMYGDYAYSAGYLGSVLAFLIAEMSEEQRERQLDQLRATVKELDKKIVAKQLAVDNSATI
jgi:5-carboxymethyl-2-hydroxymuconate isomerase